jgi:hypothetical protein
MALLTDCQQQVVDWCLEYRYVTKTQGGRWRPPRLTVVGYIGSRAVNFLVEERILEIRNGVATLTPYGRSWGSHQEEIQVDHQ